MNCPACSRKPSPKDRFCRHCGASLRPGSAALDDVRARFQRGDHAGALALLKAELKRHPDDAQLISWIGHAHYFAGREGEAREAYAIALAADPGLWDARFQLASVEFSRGEYAACAERFKEAAAAEFSLEGHPLAALFGGDEGNLRASAWLYAGLALKELGRGQEAAEALREATRLDPENPLGYGVTGDLLMAAERFDEAAQAYAGALAHVRDEASLRALRNDLGVAYFRAGRLEQAAEEFKKVIQEDPKNANAIYNLGVLYLRQGLKDEMRDDLREFLKAEEAEHILLGLTRSMVEAARRQDMDAGRGGILGKSPAITEVLDVMRRAAGSDATVLLLGENGTGKELVARAIHAQSPRRERPFVAVNCGALPETLLESELFGYEKGAFTGAAAAKPGRFELAEGGTLFLDEIGDLKLSLQVKLLRAIQEKSFERLGGTKTLRCDIRIIAATNHDLRARVASGEFREDLFYRLYVVPITLPPLRERREDIPLLARHFLERNAARTGKRFVGVHPRAVEMLMAYPWPGNVRELENVVERAVAIYDDSELKPEHLRFDLPAAAPAAGAAAQDLDTAEKQVILASLKAAGFKVPAAAKALGLSRATLYRKIQKFRLNIDTKSQI